MDHQAFLTDYGRIMYGPSVAPDCHQRAHLSLQQLDAGELLAALSMSP
jgi:hypothetical protein